LSSGEVDQAYYYLVHFEERGARSDYRVSESEEAWLTCIEDGGATAKVRKNLAYFCDAISMSKRCEKKKLREGFLSEKKSTELKQKNKWKHKTTTWEEQLEGMHMV